MFWSQLKHESPSYSLISLLRYALKRVPSMVFATLMPCPSAITHRSIEDVGYKPRHVFSANIGNSEGQNRITAGAQVTNRAAERRINQDFADLYESSDLYK